MTTLYCLRGKAAGPSPRPTYQKEQRRTEIMGVLEEQAPRQSNFKRPHINCKKRSLHLTNEVPVKQMSGFIGTLVPCHHPAPEVKGSHRAQNTCQDSSGPATQHHSPGTALRNPSHFNSWELRKITAVPFTTVYVGPGR